MLLQLTKRFTYLPVLRSRYQEKSLFHRCFTANSTKLELDEIKYEKKTPIEHILLRPGMYVGQIDWIHQSHWIYNPSTQKMMKKEIAYSPALLKIFDEILVNAADNSHRKNSQLTEIHISVNTSKVLTNLNNTQIPFTISIENDGRSIPIELHSKENVYIPELIFGHLLTGSNFDDQVERFTGGSHGYGAKLTNIFSKQFEVMIYDSERNLLYEQQWEKNMSICHPPKITEEVKKNHPKLINRKSFIKISFQPDLSKFRLLLPPTIHADTASEELTKYQQYLSDITSLFHRRSLDVAGCLSNVNVFYNKALLPVQSFQEYVRLFAPSTQQLESLVLSDPAEINDAEGAVTERLKEGKQFDYDVPVFRINDRLEFSILPTSLVNQLSVSSNSGSNGNESISFVNNVWTVRGGQHVQHIQSQVVDYIEQYLTKNYKEVIGKASLPSLIKNQLFLFINCKVENPSFDGQTKDALLTKAAKFASSMEITKNRFETFWLKEGEKDYNPDFNSTGLEHEKLNFFHHHVIQSILQQIHFQEHYRIFQSMDKSTSKLATSKNKLLIQVPKLDDAHYAGKKPQSKQCTLILTEGDSAKALAIAGLSQIGRDYHGVMPLRGKVLNVRWTNSKKQIINNQELMNLCKAMNLQFEKKYLNDSEFEELRYGSILLMCDQDHDGSHIKGLIINFIHYFWPALIERKGFVQEFITPIVKIRSLRHSSHTSDEETSSVDTNTHGKKKKGSKRNKPSMNTEESSHEENVISFYNLTEYEEWKTQNLLSPKDYQSYFIKYYKGLGTNTGEEGKEYFRNIHHHQKDFISENKQQTSDSIDLVFNKNRALDRKEWLLKNYSPSLFINFTPNTITSHPTTTSQPSPLPAAATSLSYSDFINKELIHFSFSDNVRSIPHLIDGLKPSQRKVLFGSFLKFPPSSNINKEMKVMQLAGFIAEKTSYHHGEQSLHSTIIHMAQQYLGANNVPLLQGIGQFGTRAKGGDDYASPRYIYTKLSPLTRYLFPVEDDILLKYQEDDGISIEPEYFMPILPTLLLNGSKGIGTGWSTDIPAYYIIDVIDHLLAKIEKDCVSSTTILQEERTLTPSKPLVPYYHGFKGRIFLENPSDGDASSNSEIAVSTSSQEFISEGRLRIIDRQTIEITELPIQKWTEDYKEFLLKLIEKGEIKSFQEFHTIHSITFIVKLSSQLVSKHIIDKKATSRKRKSSKKTMSASSIKGINDSKGGGKENSVDDDDDDDDDDAEEEEEHHKVSTAQKYNHPQNQQKWKNYFRLTNRILLSNMYLFNEKNQIQRFTSPEQIIDTFYPLRLQYYQYRQQYLFQSIYQQYYTLANQQRFLQLILEAKDSSPQGGGAGGGKEGNILQQLSSSEKKEEMIVLLQSYRLASEDEIIKQVQDVLLKKYLVEQLHPRLFKTLSSHYSTGLHKEEEDHSGTAVASKGNEGKIADGIESREAYDYLLKLPIYSFTKERYSSLQNRIQDTEKKIQYLESLTPYDLWKEDLLNCRKKYLEIEKKWKFD